MTTNRQKKRSLNRHLLNFFCIGMVYFRCLLLNPHVQVVQDICGKGGEARPQFQNIASKTNQRWLINYEKQLIHFGTNILKIVVLLVFWTPHNFANGLHFVALG